MLLKFDTAKIQAQLGQSQQSYIVTPCNLETVTMIPAVISSVHATGTVAALPNDIERARARVLELRQRMIDRGIKPLSGEDLDRHMDEVRGR